MKGISSVDMLPINEAGGIHKRPDRVARGQMADVFAGVTPAGGASPAPTTERLLGRRRINGWFEI